MLHHLVFSGAYTLVVHIRGHKLFYRDWVVKKNTVHAQKRETGASGLTCKLIFLQNILGVSCDTP